MSETLAVVVPVWRPAPETLVERGDRFTTMIWGWQTEGARRMVSPRRVIKRRGGIAVLYRPNDVSARVMHASFCRAVIHREEAEPFQGLDSWLYTHRIEHFALDGRQLKDWLEEEHTYRTASPAYLPRSFYVVTHSISFDAAVPFSRLIVESTGQPLSDDKTRGYAVVRLWRELQDWYWQAASVWDQHSWLLHPDIAVFSRPRQET